MTTGLVPWPLVASACCKCPGCTDSPAALCTWDDPFRPLGPCFGPVCGTGVFWLDRPMGIIPPDSFMVVTVFFGPMSPINYHKKAVGSWLGLLGPMSPSFQFHMWHKTQIEVQSHVSSTNNEQVCKRLKRRHDFLAFSPWRSPVW